MVPLRGCRVSSHDRRRPDHPAAAALLPDKRPQGVCQHRKHITSKNAGTIASSRRNPGCFCLRLLPHCPHSTVAAMIVRPYQPDDLSILTAINEASLPAVNSLTPPELGAIIAGSAATLVALDSDGRHEGFVVCLDQAADYDSRNFRWLQQQFERFYYVDRIALAPEARGRGRGEALYRSLLATLLEAGADGTVPLTCEVNERPP